MHNGCKYSGQEMLSLLCSEILFIEFPCGTVLKAFFKFTKQYSSVVKTLILVSTFLDRFDSSFFTLFGEAVLCDLIM